jgi:hypothetical protein
MLIFSLECTKSFFTKNMEVETNRKEMVLSRKADYEMRPRNTIYWYWSVTGNKTEQKLN